MLTVTPAEELNCVVASDVVYVVKSTKYPYFIDATYAFSLLLPNFRIEMPAKMPMNITTINSSISVKPLLFSTDSSEIKTTPQSSASCRQTGNPDAWLVIGIS